MKTKSSHNHHHHLDYFFDVVIFQSFLFRSLLRSFPPAVRLSAVWAQGWDQGFSVRVNSCAFVAAGLVTSIDESKCSELVNSCSPTPLLTTEAKSRRVADALGLRISQPSSEECMNLASAPRM